MSSRFLPTYDALPPDAQQLLVRRHLAPLLDAVPTHRQRRVVAAAAGLHRRLARMPPLSLAAKKAEIAALLRELSRDARRALIRERSRREQLLAEAVDTLAAWLNDIWSVVFEFRTHYALAHACLLFACDALNQIADGCGGCKCAFAGMFVSVRIRRSTGELVKSFALDGAHNLESVMLWIWRDLFLSLLATGSKRQRSVIPDMMEDIRTLLGWRTLERLLCGGSTFYDKADPADDDDDERVAREPEDTPPIDDDDGDPNYVSDYGSTPCDEQLCPRSFYAPHWSWRITNQQPRLRDLVHTALLNLFKAAPSEHLYTTMATIAEDEDELEEALHPLLMSVAGHSSENLSAALRILSMNHRTDSVGQLLHAHKHLLRPQDAASLQFAVLILSGYVCHHAHALSILEEELHDVARVFRAAIRFSFCNVDAEVHRKELAQVLALPADSLTRRTRVERWVKGILTPQADTSHPMALAALMFGLPFPPGAEGTDEGDMLGYFELDGDDPETEDLRDEFRPNIQARWQGWVDTAATLEDGPAVLLKVYASVLAEMPFLGARDVVAEMSARIVDRPSKVHVSDALEAFREFCEKQRVKLTRAQAKATRTRAAAAGTGRAGPGPACAPAPDPHIEGVD